jgi:membrane protease YdiL (CAAX protease family)
MIADETIVLSGGRESTFRQVPWRLSDVVIGLAVLLPWRLIATLDAQQLTWLNGWLYWVCYLLPCLAWIGVFPIWIARRRTSLLLFPNPRMGWLLKEALLAAALTFAMLMFLGMVILLWEEIAGADLTPPRMFETSTGTPLNQIILYGVCAAAIGPGVEELFFRGFIYNALRRRFSILPAIAIQAVIFGLMHPFGMVHRVFVSVIAVILAIVYEWRKTLWTPVLMHSFFNTLAVTVALSQVWNGPSLGVNGVADPRGCEVTLVRPDSGAEKAKLRTGDIITKCDGNSVQNIQDVARIVFGRKVGDVVDLEILRDDKPLTVHATLGRRPRR